MKNTHSKIDRQISLLFLLTTFAFTFVGCGKEFGCKNNPNDPACGCSEYCVSPTPYCDEEADTCVACTENDHCSGGLRCNTEENRCFDPEGGEPCRIDSDCPDGSVCDEPSGICVREGGSAACTRDAECPDDNFPACADGRCVPCSSTNALLCTAQNKVCNTEENRCVECAKVDEEVCTSKGWVCDVSENRCVECLVSENTPDDGAGGTGGNQGTGGQDGDINSQVDTESICTDQGLVCDAGKKFCVACALDEGGAIRGTCPQNAPVCDTDAGTCVACTDDAHCGGATPVCDTDANICIRRGCISDDDCSDEEAQEGRSLVCQGADPESDTQGSCLPGCRQNADCAMPLPVCRDGQCAAGCTESAQCALGVCNTADDAFVCVECNESADCKSPLTSKCNDANTCVPCVEGQETDAQEIGGQQGDAQDAGDCSGIDEKPFCRIENNRANECVACLTDAHCEGNAAGAHCNPTTGLCAACVTDEHCTSPDAWHCNAEGVCEDCSSHAHCTEPERARCNFGSGECVPCRLENGDAHCAGNIAGDHCNPLTDPSICVPCTNNSHCADEPEGRLICDGNTNECIQVACGDGDTLEERNAICEPYDAECTQAFEDTIVCAPDE